MPSPAPSHTILNSISVKTTVYFISNYHYNTVKAVFPANQTRTRSGALKILFYRYGSICEPDILETFQVFGFEVTEIITEIYKKDFSPKDGVTLVSETLMKTPHDCVFSVNFYPFLAEVCNIMKLRYLCWIVDSPVIELYSSSIRHPWNRIFLFDKMNYNTLTADLSITFSHIFQC